MDNPNIIFFPINRLIPLFGYYFTNGPWKLLWLKFGYDPRTDPSSKMYVYQYSGTPPPRETTPPQWGSSP